MSKKIKVSIFLAIAFFFISSRMFNEVILKKIPGALSYDSPTDKGHIAGAILIGLIYIMVSFAVDAEWL
jgi:hypothetical protein